MKILYSKLKGAIRNHYYNKYVSYGEAICNYFKTFNQKNKRCNLSSVKNYKTSNTIFILGSGPSLNRIKDQYIDEIQNHDSFGINYSFLKKEIIPTYHQFSWERTNFLNYLTGAFAPYRGVYKDVIIFLHSKAFIRLGHPRLTPSFFPENPKYCLYRLPRPIYLNAGQQFTDKDFDGTLFYRGTLSLVLDIVSKMGYKKIALLGVDLDTSEHFYENLPEMQEMLQLMHESHLKLYGDINNFESMYPKQGKAKPFDEYLYSLSDYLMRKRETELFIGFEDNLLHPKLPAYFK